MEAGFSRAEVAVVGEEQLARAIGPATRIIGISSGEPAGFGMNSSTMTAIAGGQIYPQAMFRRLLKTIRRLNRNISAKIVLGGPGAWQLADNPAEQQKLGIDHVVVGYAEKGLAAALRTLLAGEPLPRIVAGGWDPAVPIPPIRGPSTMGVVEISRGCGLGCPFCTIARVPMVQSAGRDNSRRRANQRGRGHRERRPAERGFLPLWRRGAQDPGPTRSFRSCSTSARFRRCG